MEGICVAQTEPRISTQEKFRSFVSGKWIKHDGIICKAQIKAYNFIRGKWIYGRIVGI